MSNNMRITVPETLLLTSESPKFSPAARMMVSDRHIVIVYSNIELDNSKCSEELPFSRDFGKAVTCATLVGMLKNDGYRN